MALYLHLILQHISFQDTAHPSWACFIKGDIKSAESLPPVNTIGNLSYTWHSLGTSDSRPVPDGKEVWSAGWLVVMGYSHQVMNEEEDT